MSADTTPQARDSADESSAVRDFLSKLRRQIPPAEVWPLPEPEETARQVSTGDDLPARFCRAARSAGTLVHMAERASWTTSVVDVLRAAGARTVFLGTPPDGFLSADRRRELADALAAAGFQPISATDDQTLFAVDAAITGVAAAVAETGTVVCTSGAGLTRGSSLIPPVHVAIVGAQQLLPDLCDYLGQAGTSPTLPAQVVLISGPSKTSDIEGVLVTGMHGPLALHVVLVTGQVVPDRP